MNIIDTYKPSDDATIKKNSCTPAGIIRIYDKDGNLVIEKHNMIVKSGRKLIFNSFLQKIFSSTDLTTNGIAQLSDNQFDLKANFSYLANPIKTTESLTLDQIQVAEGASGDNNVIRKELDPEITIDADSLSIKLTASFAGTETFTKFNQIYLTYVDSSTSTLFSRVALDPVYIGSDGTYTLTYTIYF